MARSTFVVQVGGRAAAVTDVVVGQYNDSPHHLHVWKGQWWFGDIYEPGHPKNGTGKQGKRTARQWVYTYDTATGQARTGAAESLEAAVQALVKANRPRSARKYESNPPKGLSDLLRW